jgi:hypothetical protein
MLYCTPKPENNTHLQVEGVLSDVVHLRGLIRFCSPLEEVVEQLDHVGKAVPEDAGQVGQHVDPRTAQLGQGRQLEPDYTARSLQIIPGQTFGFQLKRGYFVSGSLQSREEIVSIKETAIDDARLVERASSLLMRSTVSLNHYSFL